MNSEEYKVEINIPEDNNHCLEINIDYKANFRKMQVIFEGISKS